MGAHDGNLPLFFSMIHLKYRTPIPVLLAMVMMKGWGCVGGGAVLPNDSSQVPHTYPRPAGDGNDEGLGMRWGEGPYPEVDAGGEADEESIM